ncbi:NADPH-dependent FMN reductase [Gluconacetobacter johannae DSM 13595]|uniref:NAD(P)H-dependent oxidoreductase n=1 Tax=Gluconacetobacter johannae TaxID=112140 RepID=A0A7W4P4D9_9PROT|nr:NADPH-dependent FMN reductase [Gluconacetobacter johannae]MBB2174928.1 NAD(P)H-dependent oxidoreductase [Gluconacetobacter johannae]GBQ87827.1 NADPH-dependent FMN reductase [Gluconacetobacter johannae DSM 13595]
MTRILGLSGSLRRGSFNTGLLLAARDLAPEGVQVELYEGLRDIPPYDEDVRAAGFPPVVEDLRRRILEADALLFATPEYNRSVPGVLKNAIDWVSRPPHQPFDGKVAAIVGASPGALGTALAHYHLRQVLSVVGVYVLPAAETLVGGAGAKFDAGGLLTDEATRNVLRDRMTRLVDLATRLAPRV